MERRRVLELVAGALLVFGGVVNAGQEPGQVVGVASNEDGTPLEYPQLRIRDLQDGQVVASITGTVLGEFMFIGLNPGSYLVELIDANDHVLGVGQPLTLLPGDTVIIPPGARHWHGAAPDRMLCHLALSESDDSGAATNWLEPVSDSDYTAATD